MNKTETGAFIASLRREKGLTQKELAEKLSVSDKAVSRWETGKGLPDPVIWGRLSEELGVSVSELFSGRRLEGPEVKAETDKIITEAFAYSKRRVLSVGLWALFAFGLLLCVSPLFLASAGGPWPIGAALAAVSLTYLYLERGNSKMKTKDRWFDIASLIFACSALALETIPLGAVLVFANGPGERVAKTFSYFSLIPFGYANFWPFITALLTVATAALLAVSVLKKAPAPKLRNAAFLLNVFALLFSFLPLMFGWEYMNSVSYAVSGALLLSGAFQMVSNRKIK